MIDLPPAALLRAHVGRRPEEEAAQGLLPCLVRRDDGDPRLGPSPFGGSRPDPRELRDAEVEDLDEGVPFLVQGGKTFPGLEVAVDDPLGVRATARPRCDLLDDRHDLLELERAGATEAVSSGPRSGAP